MTIKGTDWFLGTIPFYCDVGVVDIIQISYKKTFILKRFQRSQQSNEELKMISQTKKSCQEADIFSPDALNPNWEDDVCATLHQVQVVYRPTSWFNILLWMTGSKRSIYLPYLRISLASMWACLFAYFDFFTINPNHINVPDISEVTLVNTKLL